MEEVRMWAIDGIQATAVQGLQQTNSEKLLEDVLVQNPSMLMEGLRLMGRQTPTQGNEALDLLGVDSDGRLVVFELKRGKLTRDAVTQAIDYTSYLASLNLDDLSDHIGDRTGQGGIEQIENFEEWYSSSFSGKSLDSLFPARMVLVGLGADEKAKRMVEFLEKSGLDISLLTFFGFNLSGQTLLAKQAEIPGTTISIHQNDGRRRPTPSELTRTFNSRAEELELVELLEPVRGMIMECLRPTFQHPAVKKRFRNSFYKLGSNGSNPGYVFIELDEENNGIKLGFYPVAIDLALDQFTKLDPKQIPFVQQKPGAQTTEKVSYEIYFPLNSNDDWETHRDELTSLTSSVYVAWGEQNSEL